jgi:deoxyxylulose-5-phosphate synthase
VAATVQRIAPDVRVAVLGAPDQTYEHAARARQLELAGLSGSGIANTVRAWAAEESLSAR